MIGRYALVVLILGLLLGGTTSAQVVQGTPEAESAAVPRFEPGSCAFPALRGVRIDCGHLVVPENRARPAGRTIRLAVAILRSRADAPASDPLVFLDGGPGGPTLQFLRNAWGIDPFLSYLDDRDVILFDQRGVGQSEPTLDCPEAAAAYDQSHADGDDIDEMAARRAAATAACRERLVAEGVDLAAYTSAASAADVADLWRVLGYERVNLLGVSYGTRLALTILRDHPEGVRSVVLDSTVPLQLDLTLETLANFDRALGVLFTACAATPACAAAYPELEGVLWTVVDRLEATPMTVQVGRLDPISGARLGEAEIVLDGDLLLGLVFQGLYFRETIELLPRLIDDLGDGRTGTAETLLEIFLPFQTLASEGAFYSVHCGDEAAFITATEVRAAAARYPRLAHALRHSALGPDSLAACAAWGAATAGPIENEAVVSDVPTLVLAGGFDPVTPPAWGRLALQTLERGTFFEIPGVGHAAAFSHPCPEYLAVAFVADPSAPPDAACIANLDPPAFAHPL